MWNNLIGPEVLFLGITREAEAMMIADISWWASLNTLEQVFWGIAIVFSVLFVFQFGLSLFGLDFESDADIDTSASDSDYSLDPSFTLLSVRSIIAFFTFFGWVGVLSLNRDYSTGWVFGTATFAGFAAMGLVAYLMYFFSRLAEDGNADIQDLIYKNGTVYLTIPERRKGKGKVHVTLGNSLREMDAVTEGEMLGNGKSVKIIEIVEDNVLVVEPIEIFESHVS